MEKEMERTTLSELISLKLSLDLRPLTLWESLILLL